MVGDKFCDVLVLPHTTLLSTYLSNTIWD